MTPPSILRGLPRPHPLAVSFSLLLLAAQSAQALVTCHLRNPTLPTDPFTVSSNLYPFGSTVYARTTLTVTCQRDDNRSSVDIEIGASNTQRGTTPRTAILTTNADWGLGYALTHGDACPNNPGATNWFDLGLGATFKSTLVFSGSSASLSVEVGLRESLSLDLPIQRTE